MSYDLYVYLSAARKASAEYLIDNMEVLGWQIRLLDDNDIVTEDLNKAAMVLAWDITYEPAPVFDERYTPGVKVDFSAITEYESCFIGSCALYIDEGKLLSELDTELREALSEADYQKFSERFVGTTVKIWNYRTGGSIHPYCFMLQTDLALITAYMSDGIYTDPQEGNSRFIHEVPSYDEKTPLERMKEMTEEFIALYSDEK